MINNQSDSILKVNYTTLEPAIDSLVTICPYTEVLLLKESSFGAAYDFEDEFLSAFFDTISIITSRGEDIQIDYLSRNTWDIELSRGFGFDGGEAIYTLSLDNDDL